MSFLALEIFGQPVTIIDLIMLSFKNTINVVASTSMVISNGLYLLVFMISFLLPLK